MSERLPKDVGLLEETIGYTFKDISYLVTAVTHSSFTNEQKSRGVTAVISTKDSKIPVIVLPTNEELMIARDTVRVLG